MMGKFSLMFSNILLETFRRMKNLFVFAGIFNTDNLTYFIMKHKDTIYMVTDELVMQGARPSVSMVLT